MKCKLFAALILTGIIFTPSAWTQQEPQTLNLSLEDCIAKALKYNLGLAIEILNPELSELSVTSAKEKFIPQLSFNYSKRDTQQASYSFLDAADEYSTNQNNYGGQISQLIPTGGTFTLSVDGYKSDTTRRSQTINPRYGSTLQFDFSQPLLKNFGFKVNRREIIIANNNLDISEHQLKDSIIDTIYNVEETYWNLVYNIEILKLRQQSLDLARDLLEKNRRAVEVGTMAQIEILSAESEVATREADIIQAEAMVKNSEDTLKTLINIAAEDRSLATARINPSEMPSFEKKDVSLEDALAAAYANRNDLKVTHINIENNQLNLNYARNQLLPNLNLNASYWSPGVSGTQLQYAPGDLFGDPIAIIPGGASDAIKDAFNFRYKNWSLALTLDIPLSSILSRASYATAKVNLKQTQLRLKNQEQQLLLEIGNTVRAVQTNFRRIEAYRAARILAKRKMEAEEEKLRVGLSTNYYVLQYQREFTNAQTNELKAIVDYNLSLAQLNKAMGITLDRKNITLTEVLTNR
ncbi:MAG: TolC family protein [Candidatus Aminicenantes bacterium]|nr:TolC family protein [Candidatus Aminicenantes bacterium]